MTVLSAWGSMGVTLIVEGEDHAAMAACVQAQASLRERPGMGPVRILWDPVSRNDSPHLSSVGRHGVMVECGPTATGLARHDICSWMEAAVLSVIDQFDALNRSGAMDASGGRGVATPIDVYRDLGVKIPCPSDSRGKPTALFHPRIQDRDYEPIRAGDPIFVTLDGQIIAYDGSFGETVCPIFINESGYYNPQSGMGFVISAPDKFMLRPVRVANWM